MGIVSDVRNKPELRDLSENFVERKLHAYLLRNPKMHAFLQKPYSVRSATYKKIIKEVRASLRRDYGLFRKQGEHASVVERRSFARELYRGLFQIIGKAQRILDLGCGLNYFALKPYYKGWYYGFDVSEREIALLQGQKNCVGQVVDIMSHAEYPPADVAFLFKMTDILDKGKGHKNTERILDILPVMWVVVSFPTVTMSGKPMNFPRRKWMELLCQRKGWSFTLLEFPSELFYVVEKGI